MSNTLIDVKLAIVGVVTFFIQITDLRVWLADSEIYLKILSLVVLILFTCRRWYLMEKNNQFKDICK